MTPSRDIDIENSHIPWTACSASSEDRPEAGCATERAVNGSILSACGEVRQGERSNSGEKRLAARPQISGDRIDK
ncbi:MAG TPA: hypothetical protein VLA12_20695 [Planctomycetaceae bacterium]|nr:hypothetical protein [Planctomycetaceae bacterium]